MFNLYFLNSSRLLFALFLGVSPQIFCTASAETLIFYDFDGQDEIFELAPDVVAEGLAPLEWTVASSSLRDFGGNPGRALATSGFSDGNAFELIVGVASDMLVTLGGYAFDHMASSSGPTEWQLLINGNTIASGPTDETFTTVSGGLNLEPMADFFTIAIQASGASSNRGTFRLDNFSLTGSVAPVPLPPSFLLLLTSLVSIGSIHLRTATRQS
ncbi:MAG: hypothetical protein ACU84Q_09980 [Gammaproteobacteria bacterium]